MKLPFAFVLSTLAVVSGLGCGRVSGNTGGSIAGSGGSTGGDASVSGNTGGSIAGSGGSPGDGSPGNGSPDDANTSCDERRTQIGTAYIAAFTNAALACVSDDDCTVAPEPQCLVDCSRDTVSKAALPALQNLVDALVPQCAPFESGACPPLPSVPCGIYPIQVPSCVAGQCQMLIPKEWSLIEFDESNAPACSPGGCRWRVTPDGTVERQPATDGGETTLTPAELGRVNAIAESATFRSEMETAHADCNPAPSGGPSIHVYRASVPSSSGSSPDVTGCIFAGPPGNDVLALWNILNGRPEASDAGP